jgi:hypothetical protein
MNITGYKYFSVHYNQYLVLNVTSANINMEFIFFQRSDFMKKALILVLVIISTLAFSVEYATTDDGERVLLYSDGTWEYVETKDEWQTVFRVDGSSSKVTERFTITSDYWRVKVDFTGSMLSLWLRDKYGELGKEVIDLDGSDYDFGYVHGSGTYSLEIISGGYYEITVQQKNDKNYSYSTTKSKTLLNEIDVLEIIYSENLIEALFLNERTPEQSVFKLTNNYEIRFGNTYYMDITYDDYDDASGLMIYQFDNGGISFVLIRIEFPDETYAKLQFLSIFEEYQKRYGYKYYGSNPYNNAYTWDLNDDIWMLLTHVSIDKPSQINISFYNDKYNDNPF